jgi:hypothetical protein
MDGRDSSKVLKFRIGLQVEYNVRKRASLLELGFYKKGNGSSDGKFF